MPEKSATGELQLTSMMRKNLIFFIFLLGLSSWFSEAVWAQLYFFRNYTAADGLPDDFVFQIRQDSKGYLWFATSSGVARYDGIQFQTYRIQDGLPDNAVRDVLEDSTGKIWISTGGGLCCLENGKFRLFSEKDGLPYKFVQTLFLDRSGILWAGTRGGGVCRFDGNRFSIPEELKKLPLKTIWDIRQDQKGDIWFCGKEGGVYRYDGQKLRAFAQNDGLPDAPSYCFLQEKSGPIWVGTGQGMYRAEKGRFRRIEAPGGVLDDVATMLEDQRGVLWFASYGRGLVKYEKGNFTSYKVPNGLANEYVISLFEDREGNLWIGTQGGGASKFSGEMFAQLNQLRDMDFRLVHSIVQDSRGNYWFGSYGKGLSSLDSSGHLKRWQTQQGLANDLVSDMVVDHRNRVYCATDGGLSIWEGGRFRNYTVEDGLPMEVLKAVRLDHRNRLWIGTFGGGVSCWDGKKFINYSTREGLLDDQVLAIHEDKQRRIWLGTSKGVSWLEGGRFRHLTQEDGLPPGRISAIEEDESGAIWFGCDTGLCRYDGKSFRTYNTTDGLVDPTIHFLKFDRMNNLWIGTNKGVSCLDAERKGFRNFNSRDGLAGDESLQGAVLLDQEGTLWFGSTLGVTRCKPEADRVNLVPPLVQIESILVNGSNIPALPPFTFDPDQNELTFQYAGLSFIDESRVRYRYLLEGFDRFWSPETVSRVARYTNLPAGQYKFRVRAANSRGVWSEAGAFFILEILPPFYRKLWFQLLATALGLVSVGGVVRWRTWLVRRHNRELDRKVKERTREVLEQKELLDRANQEMQALQDTSTAIIATLDPAELGHMVLSTAVALLNCSGGVLMRYHWNRQMIEISQVVGEAQDLKGFEFSARGSFLWEVIESRQSRSYHWEEIQRLLTNPDIQKRLVPSQAILLPMVCKERVMGLLCLGRSQDSAAFTPHEIALLATFANQAAVALRNAELYQAILASEMKYRSLVEGAGDAILAMGGKTYIESANTMAVHMLGYSIEELKTKRLEDLVPTKEVEFARSLHVIAREKGHSLQSLDLRQKGGGLLPVEIHMVALESDLFQAIVRDVTERRQLEEDLARQRDRAEEASRLKSEFLAGISHELRTPLHAILSYADFGLEKIQNVDRERLRKYFYEIKDSGSHLLAMINDLLDLSKMEAGRMVYRRAPLTLGVLIDDACFRLSQLAGSRQITILVRNLWTKAMVFGDYDMLLRVLINLLGNSIKFTPVKGQIEVAAGLHWPEQPDSVFPYFEPDLPEAELLPGAKGQEWIVGIRDNGEGIHPEELQTIFEKFIQSSRQTEKNRGGTGLGLSICRGIIDAHGGHIWAESPGPGKGSTFYFTLPVCRVETAEGSQRSKDGESCDK